MNHAARLLSFSCQRNTVVVTLAADVDEDAQELVEKETETVMLAVCEPASVVFVVDFEGQSRCRDRGLLMLLGALRKHVPPKSGKILICNPSPQDLATLQRMRLDRVWPVYPTREQALAALAALDPARPPALAPA
jgi:anti-anti-sigma regulatory factor